MDWMELLLEAQHPTPTRQLQAFEYQDLPWALSYAEEAPGQSGVSAWFPSRCFGCSQLEMSYIPPGGGDPYPESSGIRVHAKYHAKTGVCQEEGHGEGANSTGRRKQRSS